MQINRSVRNAAVAAAVCASTSIFTAHALASLVATPPVNNYLIQTINPTGGVYEYNNGSGIVRSSYLALSTQLDNHLIDPAGRVAGSATRFSSTGANLGSDAWIFDGSTTHIITVAGADYQYNSPNGLVRSTGGVYTGTSGQLAGTINRYKPDGSNSGYDVFSYNGASAQVVNPTGAGYEYTSSGAAYRFSQLWWIDATNRIMGTTNRYAADRTDLGKDSWWFNGSTTQLIGMTGAGYQYTTTGGIYRNTSAYLANPAGQIAGYSNRFSSAGDDVGDDAWVFDGTTSKVISLTGANYQFTTAAGTYRIAISGRINASGQVTGGSSRFSTAGDDLGSDSWLYNGTNTKAINLTGGVYEHTVTGGKYRSSDVTLLADDGHVIGYSNRFASDGTDLGEDVWYYNGSNSKQINLTGGAYEYSLAGSTYRYGNAGNTAYSNGKVLGASNRYASDGSDLGIDTWHYNGTTTKVINLTGPGYEFSTAGGTWRNSVGYSLFSGGAAAVGSSDRAAADGTFLGADIWYYNGTTTTRINPVGGNFEYTTPAGNYRLANYSDANDNGFVIGITGVYNASGNYIGEAGWFYDASNSLTYPLEFSFSTDGACNTQPVFVTDTGVVLGTYTVYSGSSNLGTDSFWWSESAGFHDLGSLANGLSAAQWSMLNTVWDQRGIFPGNAPQFILASDLNSLNSGDSSSIFLLTAQLPEPNSLLLVFHRAPSPATTTKAITACIKAKNRPPPCKRGRPDQFQLKLLAELNQNNRLVRVDSQLADDIHQAGRIVHAGIERIVSSARPDL